MASSSSRHLLRFVSCSPHPIASTSTSVPWPQRSIGRAVNLSSTRFVSSSSTNSTSPYPNRDEATPKAAPPPPPPRKRAPASNKSSSPPRDEGHGSSSSHHSPSSPPTPTSTHPRDRLKFAESSTLEPTLSDSTAEQTIQQQRSSPSTSTDSLPDQNSNPIATTEIVTAFPPPPEHHPIPIPRVPFSTYRFVKRLERSEIKSELANEIMHATRNLLLVHEDRAMQDLVGRQELENEAYLFTAALQELKTGSQIKSRNDGIALRSMTAVLQRETDSISQKLKEDMQRLQSDIQLDMNSRKEETSQELKQLDVNIMDLNSKFTILLGEVRTEIEATKWISTRRVMTVIIAIVVLVIAYVSSGPLFQPTHVEPPTPPSIEELGVDGRGGEEAEVTPPGGWSFWSTGSGTATKEGVKRVGEEGPEASS